MSGVTDKTGFRCTLFFCQFTKTDVNKFIIISNVIYRISLYCFVERDESFKIIIHWQYSKGIFGGFIGIYPPTGRV